MKSPRNVLLLGPGYVGGVVLDNLLAAGHAVTVLVRRAEQVPAVSRSGELWCKAI